MLLAPLLFHSKVQFAYIGIYKKFASAFVKAVQSLHVGNGLEESTSQVCNCVKYDWCILSYIIKLGVSCINNCLDNVLSCHVMYMSYKNV
jgi:hypothetical protein